MAETTIKFAIEDASNNGNGNNDDVNNKVNDNDDVTGNPGTNPGTSTKDGTGTKDGTDAGTKTGTKDNDVKQASADVTADKTTNQQTTTTDEPNAKLIAMKSANTGILTDESGSFASLSSLSQEPLVFGTLLFVGIILLVAFIGKLKNRKNLGFKKSMAGHRHATTALGLLSLLMIFAGAGGAVTKFMGSSALEKDLEDVITGGTITATLVDADTNLYCATDTVTPDGKSDYGYYLLMHADNGELASNKTGISNITSAENWADLEVGQWGYYVGDQSGNTYNPMPIGNSIIVNKQGKKTGSDPITVTYCAKIDKDITEASFSTVARYTILPIPVEGGDYTVLDYNSDKDDDGDGISNREENRYGMNPFSSDSDRDGLFDGDEFCGAASRPGNPQEDNCATRSNKYGTDPLSKDSDDDGLYDYSELELGTDPLVAKTNGVDLDGDRTFTYTDVEGKVNGIPFTVTGTGNVPITYIQASEPSNIDSSLETIGSTVYSVRSAGELTNASITVPYVSESSQTGDDTNEVYGAVAVGGDTITASDVFAQAITFSEDTEETDKLDVNLSANQGDITVNTDAGKITIPITIASGNKSAAVIVGQSSQEEVVGAAFGDLKILKSSTNSNEPGIEYANEDLDTGGTFRTLAENIWKGVKIAVTWIGDAVDACKQTQCLTKALEATNDFLEVVRVFVNILKELFTGEVTCPAGQVYDSVKHKCVEQGTGEGDPCETDPTKCVGYSAENSFNPSNDGFKFATPYGYAEYDGSGYNTRSLRWDNGEVSENGFSIGMSRLARLLYIDGIDFNKSYYSEKGDYYKFDLTGLSKNNVLSNYETLPINGPDGQRHYYMINKNGKAIYSLSIIGTDYALTSATSANGESPAVFLNNLYSSVKSGDPAILLNTLSSEYKFDVFNVIRIEKTSAPDSATETYSLTVYDSTKPNQTQSRVLSCTTTSCSISGLNSAQAGRINDHFAR